MQTLDWKDKFPDCVTKDGRLKRTIDKNKVFAYRGDHFKIGITHNLKKRVSSLSSIVGKKLKVISYIKTPDARALEKKILETYTCNPYSEGAFKGCSEWRTLTEHELKNIRETYYV